MPEVAPAETPAQDGQLSEQDRLALVAAADAYLDAVPRGDADAVEVGPLTLFSSRGAWNYYARPSIAGNQAVTAADVARLGEVCRELSLPLSLEWLPDVCPSLEPAAREHGLVVHDYVLMALLGAPTAAKPGPASTGLSVRVLDPDDPEDPAVPMGRAVADVAFGAAGTAPAEMPGPAGAPGIAERNDRLRRLDPVVIDQLRDRMATGAMVMAVSEREPDGVVGSGAYQQVGDVAEVVGVATLPALQRQGIATAVSALLARTAVGRGVRLLILSAGDKDIARIYAGVGFTSIGRSLAAEPREEAD